MSTDEQDKDRGAAAAIPTAASFAETLRTGEGRRLFALLARGGAFVKVPINFLSAAERAAIDAELADPFPPRKYNPQGQPYLDIYDKEHRKACDAKALERLKARVAALVPSDWIGTSDRAEKVRRIWSGWSEADILTYDRQGTNPYEVREEGVQARMEQHAPFVKTDTGGSSG